MTARVVTTPGARYPHCPVCACGWRAWGYLTVEAAQNVAAGHVC